MDILEIIKYAIVAAGAGWIGYKAGKDAGKEERCTQDTIDLINEWTKRYQEQVYADGYTAGREEMQQQIADKLASGEYVKSTPK